MLPDASSKPKKIALWMAIKDSPPSQFDPWTAEDDAALTALETEAIAVEDTVLGKEQSRMKSEAVASLTHMSTAELEVFEAQVKQALDKTKAHK